MRGVEVESEYYVSSALNVFASLGVTDSEFIDFVLDGTDLAGRAFPQSPSWNGAVGLGWRDPRGWFASGTFSYTDDAYTEIAAPLFTQVSSRSLLGAVSATADRDGQSICGAPICSTTSTSWRCSTGGCSGCRESTDGWPTRAPSGPASTSTGSGTWSTS